MTDADLRKLDRWITTNPDEEAPEPPTQAELDAKELMQEAKEEERWIERRRTE